jgi:hypothetical protein
MSFTRHIRDAAQRQSKWTCICYELKVHTNEPKASIGIHDICVCALSVVICCTGCLRWISMIARWNGRDWKKKESDEVLEYWGWSPLYLWASEYVAICKILWIKHCNFKEL